MEQKNENQPVKTKYGFWKVLGILMLIGFVLQLLGLGEDEPAKTEQTAQKVYISGNVIKQPIPACYSEEKYKQWARLNNNGDKAGADYMVFDSHECYYLKPGLTISKLGRNKLRVYVNDGRAADLYTNPGYLE